ncbi:MAG: DinB family protein [Armatimonadota bacterium]|nr:DinB family protein [Armatimonadota bacterium]
MPNTTTVEQAKAEFLRAKEAITQALATTPDDRINWSSAPTARTPIECVAHAAFVVKGLHGVLNGQPLAASDPVEADRGLREWEKQFHTRDAVLSLLEQNSADYVAWLDALTPERLASMVEMPFNSGPAPMIVGLTLIPGHMNWHTAQVNYIQTIYGDRDWHW